MTHATSTYARCDDTSIAARLAALAHPARLAIVRRLASSDACCCKDVVHHLDLAQSTVSQHLKELKKAGLIQGKIDPPKGHGDHLRTRSPEHLGNKVLGCEFPGAGKQTV